MLFKYGINNTFIDVTNIVLNKFKIDNLIIFPAGNKKFYIYFGDPVPNIVKNLIISVEDYNDIIIDEREINEYVYNCDLNILSVKNYNKIDELNSLLNPITFSIPEEKITNIIPTKTKIISSLIPGRTETYIYNTEEAYYDEYKKSLFAITTRKSGWDCMRHYEILANGCIPYFPNIEQCPIYTMYLLPKELIKEGNILYDKYKNKTIDEIPMTECNNLITKLLQFTKDNLTTHKLAQYILQKTNNMAVKKILYLSGDINTDYLRCVTLHGFKILFGTNCHDYPKIPHLYKNCTIPNNSLYGKGMSYSKLLNDELHDDNLDVSVEQDIREKKYDIIIYGSYHRGMPYYDLVQQYYSPNHIILLCGEDLHWCDYQTYINKGHYVFVREL